MNLNNSLDSEFIINSTLLESFDVDVFFMDRANFWNSDTYE